MPDTDKIKRALLLTRLVDEAACACLEAGEIPFYLSVAGHEAAAVGGAAGLSAADWVFPGFHQLGVAVWRGVPLERLAGRVLGTAVDPGLGRELPGFQFSRQARIAPATPNLGAHLLQAYGVALGIRMRGASEVVLAYAGSASEATSAFAQAVRRAREETLPMIVLVEGSGGARSATDIADRVARVAETARGGGGLQILRFKQSKKALDQLGQEDACRALVEEAFAAARQAGPVEPSRVFDEVLELGNPTLERQARWFTRQEARDDR